MKWMYALLATIAITSTSSIAATATNTKDTDPTALGWLITVNEGEIDAAKAAKNRKLNTEVEEFAALMLDQHSENLDKTREVSKEEKITATQDNATITMEKKVKNALKKMEKMADKTFEKEYVNLMVKGHADALKTLDQKYARTLHNEKVKAHFVETRKHIEQHLEKAKELKKELHD